MRSSLRSLASGSFGQSPSPSPTGAASLRPASYERQLPPIPCAADAPTAPKRSPAPLPGPYRASDIREGEPYELSNGHRIHCMSGGQRHGEGVSLGAYVLRSDPAVHSAPIDMGIVFNDGKNLRAPDIVVADVPFEPGYFRGVPPLCVEYADTCQDEANLKQKIKELLALGVAYIWVVRLVGPLRVEVYQPGKRKRIVSGDGVLRAPGVLQNPIPVRAMVDATEAERLVLRNGLARAGYVGLDEALAQARQEGEARGEALGEARGEARGEEKGRLAALSHSLLTVLHVRGFIVSAVQQAQIATCHDAATFDRWLLRAVTAQSPAQVFLPDP